MKKTNIPLFEVLFLLVSEIITAGIISVVFLLLQKFNYTVILGAALGCAVATLNFLFLAITTGRIFDRIAEERGSREMTEEEADAFAKKHEAELSAAVKRSFIIRSVTMLLALVLAFLTSFFNVLATLIPLLLLRPYLTLGAIIKDKLEKKREGGDK